MVSYRHTASTRLMSSVAAFLPQPRVVISRVDESVSVAGHGPRLAKTASAASDTKRGSVGRSSSASEILPDILPPHVTTLVHSVTHMNLKKILGEFSEEDDEDTEWKRMGDEVKTGIVYICESLQTFRRSERQVRVIMEEMKVRTRSKFVELKEAHESLLSKHDKLKLAGLQWEQRSVRKRTFVASTQTPALSLPTLPVPVPSVRPATVSVAVQTDGGGPLASEEIAVSTADGRSSGYRRLS